MDAMETFASSSSSRQKNKNFLSPSTIGSRLRTAFGRIRGGKKKKKKGLNAANSKMENRLAAIRVQHEHADEEEEDDDDEEQGGEESAGRSVTPWASSSRGGSNLLSRLKLAFVLLLIYAVLWFALRFIRLTAAARMDRELLESGMLQNSISTTVSKP